MRQSPPSKSPQQGAVLIEALVAIMIFSLGVLAIVGLQGNMIKNVADSKYRSEASYIAQSRIAQMWADDPANLAGYIQTSTPIPALLPGGTLTIATPATGQYTVTVTWLQPGTATTHNYTTTARITGN